MDGTEVEAGGGGRGVLVPGGNRCQGKSYSKVREEEEVSKIEPKVLLSF